MASIYDKFKSPTVAELKAAAEEDDSNFSTGNRGEFESLKDGLNPIRIFPKHPTSTSKTYLVMRSCWWVSIENDEQEMVRRTVSNGRIHGGLDEDICEVYLKMAKEKLAAEEDEKKLKLLTSYEKGFNPSTTWLFYGKRVKDGATVGNKPSIFEVKKSVRDGLIEESQSEGEDESINVDMFTNPIKGHVANIKYNKAAKKATDYYKVRRSEKSLKLSEEELEEYIKMPPLEDLNYFKYGREDFDKALEGIRNYDEEHEIGVAGSEEFLAAAAVISDAIGESSTRDDSDDEKKSTAKVVAKKPVVKKTAVKEETEEEQGTEEEQSGDKFDKMSRNELVAYKKEQGYDTIKLLKTDSDDDMREKLRSVEPQDESEEEATEEATEEAEEVEEVKVEKKVVAPAKKTVDLAAIKDRLKKGSIVKK